MKRSRSCDHIKELLSDLSFQSFTFRYECMNDMINFLNTINENYKSYWIKEFNTNFSMDGKMRIDFYNPSSTFSTQPKVITLEILREILSQISDGHVMLQSVNYTKDYTGDRYYK